MQIAVARVMVLIEPDEIVWDCGVYGLSSRVCVGTNCRMQRMNFFLHQVVSAFSPRKRRVGEREATR